MFLRETSPPLSQSAGFLNKFTILCPNHLSLTLLACPVASSMRQDQITISQGPGCRGCELRGGSEKKADTFVANTASSWDRGVTAQNRKSRQGPLLLLLLSHLSRVQLCATPQTAAHQSPPSLGFSRQEHWSGLPFPSPMHESEK